MKKSFKYEFPVSAAARSMIPKVDSLLTEVEKTFQSFTGQDLNLSYGQVPLMTVTVESTEELHHTQVKTLREKLLLVLSEKYPKFEMVVDSPRQVQGKDFMVVANIALDKPKAPKKVLTQSESAAISVCNAWDRLNRAGGHPTNAATAMLSLGNAIANLSTWLPGYNVKTGLVEQEEE